LVVVENNLKKMCGSGWEKYRYGNTWKLILKKTQVRAWAVQPVRKKNEKKKKKKKKEKKKETSKSATSTSFENSPFHNFAI
jgi:hypothetical protein